MLAVVFSSFIVALLMVFLGKIFKGKLSLLLAVLPLLLFIYFLSKIPDVASGNNLFFHYEWIPSIGINFDFYLDGLSLLFCLLITGIGFLIFVYASSYLKGDENLDRFFGYLSMFMGSMLGIVLSDNVLTLLVFWELTSISSFFLIGFYNDNADSRKSALTALAITGGGGFLLLAGFILLQSVGGSFSIRELLVSSGLIKAHGFYTIILLLIFAGAFTKSAQFPFHFWLPGAMKAPTPVSAYLHSATMVKAGVYLIARFTPVLGEHVYWNNTLMIVGGITMLYTAFHAIFRIDLKSILAYSTIAALGMLMFLLGIGTHQALIAVAVFILVHALYKAGLFLIVGVIDYETETRDVTVLKGLRHVMLPVAIAGLLAALSNAGIPFTFGFLGKDLIYEATLNYKEVAVWLTVLVVITNILLLYAGFVAGIKPFTGKLPSQFKGLHLPTVLMWFPPLLLGVLGFIIGSFPGLIDKSIVQPVVLSMYGGAVYIPLKIWHGFNLVLLLSIITITVGLLLYWLKKPSHQQLKFVSLFENASPQHLVFVFTKWIEKFSSWYTRTLLNGYLRYYIIVILIFLISLVSFKLFTGVNIYVDSSDFHELTTYEILITIIMFCAVILVCATPSRLTAVASMGVVGYCLCLFFVFYSAPDLAMTQFAIDTLTVVLFVLVLFKLPPFINYSSKGVKIRDALIGLLFGSLITIVALEVLNESLEKDISRFYSDNVYTLAKGKNVVNVILVDFRGFDTMIEITVLAIAAIGVYGLIKFKISKDERPII